MEVEVVQSLASIAAKASPIAKFASSSSGLSVEEHVLSLIDRYELCSAHIRSSSTLQDIFHQIVLAIAERGYIHSWGLYCMKTRLDALQRLTVDQLCIPQYLSALGVGASELSAVPLFSALSLQERKGPRDPLIEQVRMLLKDIFLLFVRSENALLQEGSDQNLDTARALLFLGLIRLKCSPIYPQSITLKEYGPRALEALSCHILGVSVVSSTIRLEVQNATKLLVNALHAEDARGIEVDNLALVQLLLGFFQWLRSSQAALIKDCRREEILQAVNPSVRGCLKEETYHSPSHMVQVYHTKYKAQLHNLPIPIQPYSMKDIKQAHKDISRENIRVNKVVFSPASSQGQTRSTLPPGVSPSKDGGGLPFPSISSAPSPREGWGGEGAEEMDATEAIASELQKVVVFLCGLSDPSLLQVSPRMVSRKAPSRPEVEVPATSPIASTSSTAVPPAAGNGSSQGGTTSAKKGNWKEDFEFFESPRALSRKQSEGGGGGGKAAMGASAITATTTTTVAIFAPTAASRALDHDEVVTPVCPSPTPSIYRDLHRMLLAYTLLAASRTFAGGDAFMILNDLYGGDGLVFCPMSSSAASGAAGASGGVGSSSSSKGSVPPPSPLRRTRSVSHSSGLCDCQVAITTTGIKVKMREQYKLVASADLHRCSNAQQLPPALGYFECTTTTIIILSPPTTAMEKTVVDLGRFSFAQLFEVLISHPQRIVHRAVTIEPYL